MKSRLKNLYKHLIENQKHLVEDYRDKYGEFYSEVDKFGKRISSGSVLTANDEDFLRKLLYETNNGIASRGQSTLSKDDFKKIINDDKFMQALSNLICDPNHDRYLSFCKVWENKVSQNNPLLINRVAAACTNKVSTTVDSGKFNEIFNWLQDEHIIPNYSQGEDWFSKNIFLMNLIHTEFEQEIQKGKTDEFYLSIFVWMLYEYKSNPFNLKKQIIKYGAPGTGKTYKARQQTSLHFDIWKEEYAPKSNISYEDQVEIVQFHPSFSYEDFMEGLRPVLDEQGIVQLKLQNGVFKEFCQRAGKWEIDYEKLKEKPKGENGKDKTFNKSDRLTISDLLPYRDQLNKEDWQDIFDLSNPEKLVADAIPPFFLIIDEVNRAELSRVFGELMYCLEYRGVTGAIKTQYANLNNDVTGMLKTNQGYKFFIPSNIYLIGTMNTIDRSVESFDFALRRRFFWEEVMPNTELLAYHLKRSWKDLASNLKKLNEEISKQTLLGSDYQIGHSYLMNLEYSPSLTVNEVRERIWDDSIRPLLQEYLRGTGKEDELISSFKNAFGVKK